MAGIPRELVERLYAAPPDGFVAARAEAVAAARAGGDVAGAREIGKLRKPTVAAWLVNLLALRRPDLMAELVELSAALRAAQRELRGPRLRELSVRRRDLVSGLVGQARALAGEAEPRLAAGKLPMAEVEATLNAALADVDVAEQARSGRLVRAASYAGFGEVPRPQLRLIVGGPDVAGADVTGPDVIGAEETGPDVVEAEETGPDVTGPDVTSPDVVGAEETGPDGVRTSAGGARKLAEGRVPAGRGVPAEGRADRAGRVEKSARTARRRALERALDDARTEQERAEAELAGATEAERDAAAALAEIEAALAELVRRRSAAEREVSRRKLARKTAERGAVAARRRVGEVQAAAEAVTAEGET